MILNVYNVLNKIKNSDKSITESATKVQDVELKTENLTDKVDVLKDLQEGLMDLKPGVDKLTCQVNHTVDELKKITDKLFETRDLLCPNWSIDGDQFSCGPDSLNDKLTGQYQDALTQYNFTLDQVKEVAEFVGLNIPTYIIL